MATVKTKSHKCLLYWHKSGLGNIPYFKDETGVHYLQLFGGYNTFDSEHLDELVKQNRDYLKGANSPLSLWGIKWSEDEKGKITCTETDFLEDITANELEAICNETTNPATLTDLENPDVVGYKHEMVATKRKKKIAEAKGTEPETIDTRADAKIREPKADTREMLGNYGD